MQIIQKQSWAITDEFWEEVRNLMPEKPRDPNKEYKRAAGVRRKPMESRKILEAIFYVLRTGYSGKHCQKKNLEHPVQFTDILWHGAKLEYSKTCGN